MSDQITYTGAILEHLHQITQCKGEFDAMAVDMDKLRDNVRASWDKGSAEAFETAHRKWSNDVQEIQQVLAQIIRAATDGHGDMAATESAVAKSFHA